MNVRQFSSEYVPHTGGKNPIPGRHCHVIFRSGSKTEGEIEPVRADDLDWSHRDHMQVNSYWRDGEITTDCRIGPRSADIIAFRLITKNPPRLGALQRWLDSVTLIEGPGGLPELVE